MRYGERRRIGSVEVSFHPAGHVLGSAQIRIAGARATTVVSGDYKLAADPTCTPFEPVRCDALITESTFGLPIFRWDEPDVTMRAIAAWWSDNRSAGEASVLFAYALGKAQRILAGLAAALGTLPGPVYCHGAIERINAAYRAAGVALPPTRPVADATRGDRVRRRADPRSSVRTGEPWMRRFDPLPHRLRLRLDGDPRRPPPAATSIAASSCRTMRIGPPSTRRSPPPARPTSG